MRRLPLVLAVCAIALLLSGCEASFSTANIGSAVLARGYENGNASGLTTTFRPSDRSVHVVVTLNNAPDGTTVKVEWDVVKAGGDRNYKIDSVTETTSNGENIIDAHLDRGTSLWPAGTYKAVVYLNGSLDRTLHYSVR